MKVLLIKDVYKLGRAGDVKKVADGYGRNFLLPQGLAVLATPGALAQAEHIRSQANTKRAILNNELGGVAEVLAKLTLTFPMKAGETGKLYGSITPAMIAETIQKRSGVEIQRRQMDIEPIRSLGTYNVPVRLTVDLIPEITVIVHREGETVEMLQEAEEEQLEEAVAGAETEVEAVVEEVEE
jgi:large subunit ribosomal protein L9